MLVDAYLAEAAEIAPDKPAIVCAGVRWTYAQIRDRSRALADALVRSGVQRGDRVLICLDNSIETIIALFAALEAGAAFVIVNPQSRLDRLAFVLNDSGASAFVARARHITAVAKTASPRALRVVFAVGSDPCTATPAGAVAMSFDAVVSSTDPAHPAHPAHSASDLAALVYTSGSAGPPKGVMLTHRNLTAAAESICAYLHLTADDVILNVLPLSFTYGLGQITTAFRSRATVVLERSFAYPQTIIDTLIRERVTGFPIVPTLAALLLQQPLPSGSLTCVRYITNAAAALPAAKIQALQQAFPSAAIVSMYGQTECQRVSYLPPECLASRPTSVGIPIPGTDAWVADDNGRRVPPGTVGELVVEGPHVMAGYWNDPEGTARAVREGPAGAGRDGGSCAGRRLYTGDLFRMDADGFLYFVDRKDDIIKTRGEKVAPRAVEEVIASMPAVADVAVLGVPDALLGAAIAAVIIPRKDARLTREHVRQHCRRHLEEYMIPTIVDIRSGLPTTLSGKVNRRALRTLVLQTGQPVETRVDG